MNKWPRGEFMSRVFGVLICALAVALALVPAQTEAGGSCGFRGYGYSSYSYGYKPGYSAAYSGSAYYGYSYYYPGSAYWGGGWYGGDAKYPAGWYGRGYYDAYTPCNYHAEPYFVKYRAVIPLVELPSYGAAYHEGPPERTAVGAAVGAGAGYGGGYSAAPTANAIDGKLDRILVAVQTVSTDVAELKAWRATVDARIGTPPPAAGAGRTPTTPPPPPANANAEKPDGPSILFARCASCHDSKAVARERSKITLFVTGTDGPEMAQANAKGEIEPLGVPTLRKIEKVLADGTMPPQKDAGGKAVAQMTLAERKDTLEFIRKVLAGGAR